MVLQINCHIKEKLFLVHFWTCLTAIVVHVLYQQLALENSQIDFKDVFSFLFLGKTCVLLDD